MIGRLGGLVGQNPLSYNLESSPVRRYISRNRCSFPSINCFPSLERAAELRDDRRYKHYKRRGKTQEEIEKQIIGEGDMLNMHDLLFTNNRDYLVKYNNQQVKAKQLEGKVIALLFVPLNLKDDGVRYVSVSLMEVYDNLQWNNVFEVVFVGVKYAGSECYGNKNSHENFLEMFSFMPWPAIPFSDIPSGKSLQKRYGFPEAIEDYYSIFIVDSTGMILQSDLSEEIIRFYGASGFPFSNERIKYLVCDDIAAATQPLSRIMASPLCDYVISNKGEKVPIHTLDDKIVALYFFQEFRGADSFTEYLKIAYEELAKNKENFEVVLVYITDTLHTHKITNEESFWKIVKTVPWLAVPFKDPINKKLQRIFEYLPDWTLDPITPPTLVIFGPRGEFIEPCGGEILDKFGISAYPFTRAKVAKLETEKVKDLKLELMWDSNTVFRRKDGSQVPFSQLLGKGVILIFHKHGIRTWSEAPATRFLKMLKEMYLQMKGTNDEFEVIHVFVSEMGYAKIEDITGDAPWLVSLESELLPGDFGVYTIFGYEDCLSFLVFAFDRDGRLVRRTIYPTFEIMEFPFCTFSLEDDILAQLNLYEFWNYWDYYPFGGRIYSAKDKLLKVDWYNGRVVLETATYVQG